MRELTKRLNEALAGQYRVERELGRGGAAIIYLAHDLKHDRKVALKVLRPDLALALGPDRFLREIQIAAKLSHPHILPVHDSGSSQGFLYFVMPFVDGESLRERLEREGQLELPDVVALMHDLLDSLQHAHERGIVHRDIKPGNVMISGRHALVMDFGVAKAVRAAARVEDDDSQGVVLGTPTYMAPEQASADPNIDHRADIYAVGAMAYEMLTGRPPFQGSTAQAVLAAHVTQSPTPVAELRPDTPPMLSYMVMRCLEKDPQQRFDSAEQAAQVLETLVPRMSTSRESFDTTAVSLQPVARQRRRRRWVAVGGVLGLAAIIGTVMVRGPMEVSAAGRPVIVVLPFENLGSPEDEFFASGITDAITARLASLGSLGVISRTSAMQYSSRQHTTREIANDLRVDYILEGTIQRERPGDTASRVRIIPQLIRVSDDTHLWASVYDEEMTEVFRLQSDIAERVARALDIALLDPQRESIERRQTDNLQAYELYLRGHDYLEGNAGNGDANARRIAIDFFEGAIALDGEFTVAWAELSLAHIWLYHYFVDPSASRAAMAKAAVDTALALGPEEPAVHLALGHYFSWGPNTDPLRAMEEFEHVTERQPNNAYARTLISALQAATGDWDDALQNAAMATDLAPREPEWASSAGAFHQLARRYADAEGYLDRAIALAPDFGEPYRYKIALYLRWRGDVDRARAVADEMLRRVTPGEVALALTNMAPVIVAGGTFDSVFDNLTPASLSGPLPFDYFHVMAEYNRLRNRSTAARAYYDSLRVAVEQLSPHAGASDLVEMFMGRAYAGLGQHDRALEHAQHLETKIENSTDQVRSRAMHESLVWINAMVGEYDSAVEHIEHLLAIPSLMSIPYLRIAELPGDLRAHPRLQEILAESVVVIAQ